MFNDDGGVPASQVEPAEYEALPPPSSDSTSSSHLDIVSFCVDPSMASDEFSGSSPAPVGGAASTMKRRGVVGTITYLADGKSAMVWFGWGDLLPSSSSDASENNDNATSSTTAEAKVVGCGVPASMGPMVLSMPRTSYQNNASRGGGSGSGGEAATTQLIGGESEEDMVVGHQMAARLSKKLGMPIYVSCSIHSSPVPGGGGGAEGGMDSMGGGGADEAPGFGGSLGQRAAALAEREVGRILLAATAANESG